MVMEKRGMYTLAKREKLQGMISISVIGSLEKRGAIVREGRKKGTKTTNKIL